MRYLVIDDYTLTEGEVDLVFEDLADARVAAEESHGLAYILDIYNRNDLEIAANVTWGGHIGRQLAREALKRRHASNAHRV